MLDFDEAVTAVVDGLKQRGMTSPYLRAFVVARVNPLRFIKGEPPPLDERFWSAAGVRRAQAMWSASPAASSQMAIALTLKLFSLRLNAVAFGGTRSAAPCIGSISTASPPSCG